MSLTPLSTTVSAQSDAFVRGMEKCRGSLRNLIASLDPVAAATNRYNKQVAQLENAVKRGTFTVEEQAVYLARMKQNLDANIASMTRAGASSGAMRVGLQNVGFQVQDFAVQVVGGTDALRAFSLQAPQLIGAFQMMGGNADGAKGRFAAFTTFLGGPWGVALGAAIPVMGLVAKGLFGMGDASDEAASKVDRLRNAIDRLKKEQGTQADVAELQGETSSLRDQRLEASTNLDSMKKYGAPYEIILDQKALIARLNAKIANNERLIAFNEIGLKGQEDAAAFKATPPAVRTRGTGSTIVSPEKAAEIAQLLAARKDLAAAGLKVSDDAARDLIATRKMLADAVGDLRSVLPEGGLGVINVPTGTKKSAGYTYGGDDDPTNQLADRMLAARESLAKSREYMVNWANQAAAAAENVGTSWVKSTDAMLEGLNAFTAGLKNGGFLEILQGVYSAFGALSQTGLFGGKLATAFGGLAGARALGGPVMGGSSYLVGERGPEIFTPDRSGYIVPNNEIGGRRGNVMQFDLRGAVMTTQLLQQMNQMAASTGVRAAAAGSAMAQSDMARSARNRIPSRFR